MSLLLKVTKPDTISAESLSLDMGMRLQVAAARDLKNKLETGKAKIVNGRYVFDSSMKVTRPPIFAARDR